MPNQTITLYCLPCAGASAAIYFPWRRKAPHWLRIEPVELPGRGMRSGEPPIPDFERLTAQLTNELAEQLSGPFALCGHSFGALLAYGIAHGLCANRKQLPVALFVAGCSAPTFRDDTRLARLDNDDAIIDELRELRGTPSELFDHPELLRLTVALANADFSACRSFRRLSEMPLDLDIFVSGGLSDEVKLEGLYAWSLESSRRTDVTLFEGGHFFLREKEELFLADLFAKLAQFR
ncbi:thioesterase II family protein [Methylocystis bryophila]|uniref:Thioesterase domain-containing protein n=2 Tax=Methylocystis bryophila TaxID=655015 RepID=A0A1W6N2F3_9HYPH|nr:alpha/beta fold hydrolase [Methylocystis bryophila]ARN83998.1 hypothetical protein B1812_22190 [Methylocystis bryophila]